MENEVKETKKGVRVQGGSIRLIMIVSYVLIALISIGSIAVLTYYKTSSSMTNKVGKLTTAINDQIRLGINDQFNNVEDICSLIFSNSQTYQYYDSDESIEDYEKIQIKSDIESTLLTNSLMTNFGDFCIIYDNNKSVGKLASSTSSLFGSDTIYDKASGYITREATHDGWVTGIDGSYTRMFYVKKVNDHAVLLASIYVADLEALMEISDEMQGMEINIVGSDNKIIFSTSGMENGTLLESELISRLENKIHGTFIFGDYLYTTNTLNDEWRIVSSIKTDTVLEEVYEIRNFTVIIAVVFVIISIVLGILFAQIITGPIQKLVKVIKKAETGDLTVKADFKAIGDIRVLNSSFNGMLTQIKGLVADTEEVSRQVADEVEKINEISINSRNISENISIAIEDIAKGSGIQYDRSQESFESLEKLADNISYTISSISEVGTATDNTRNIGSEAISQIAMLKEQTNATNRSLEDMRETFEVLVREVKNIEEVLTFILGISDETSMLAMNASIEAARAGEAGKGFNVVAVEVSKLAKQTEESTNNINEVITKIKTHVNSTMDILQSSSAVFMEQSHMVDKMIKSFEKIISSTNSINEKIDDVRRKTDEMNLLKEESLIATRSILEVAENSSANTEEVASVTVEELEVSKDLAEKANMLSEQMERLRESISKFTVDKE